MTVTVSDALAANLDRIMFEHITGVKPFVPFVPQPYILKRMGRKRFAILYPGGGIAETHRCGYPEAQRRFAAFMVTRRLTGIGTGGIRW